MAKDMKKGSVIVIQGPPASGKGVFGEYISEKYELPKISTGDLLRENVKDATEIGLEAKKYMEAGQLVPTELVNKLLEIRMNEDDCRDGFLLDGYPRTLEQAEVLNKMLKPLNQKVDLVINLDVPTQLLIDRVLFRTSCPDCKKVYNSKFMKPIAEGTCDVCGGKLESRSDDTEETIKSRIAIYEEQTKGAIDYYTEAGLLKQIKADSNDQVPVKKSIDEFIAEIK